MPICKDCGNEIEFRYIDGTVRPLHITGSGCSANQYESVSTQRAATFREVCFHTSCPECGGPVYFIRHNDGSVWVDSLGWPWPKHACFYQKPEPAWYSYFQKRVNVQGSAQPLFGVVTRIRRLFGHTEDSTQLLLAIDCGSQGRICLATSGSKTDHEMHGSFVIVDTNSKRIITSNREERPIFPMPVKSEQFDLGKDWATIEHG